MKFRIETIRGCFSKEKAEKLMMLGFEFEFVPDIGANYHYKRRYNKVYIEIESVDQLIELGNKVDCDLIIDSKNMILFIDDK